MTIEEARALISKLEEEAAQVFDKLIDNELDSLHIDVKKIEITAKGDSYPRYRHKVEKARKFRRFI